MLKAIFNWFAGSKPDPRAQAPRIEPSLAPYKIEPPVIVPILQPTSPESTTQHHQPLPAAEPMLGKPMNDHVEATDPVAEPKKVTRKKKAESGKDPGKNSKQKTAAD